MRDGAGGGAGGGGRFNVDCSEIPQIFKVSWLGVKSSFSKSAEIFTPHAQRERGKEIDRGVHM